MGYLVLLFIIKDAGLGHTEIAQVFSRMDIPYPGTQYFHQVQDQIFEPIVAVLSQNNMEAYRITPEGGTSHSLIMCDSAWDSRRQASHCYHPVLTQAHGSQAKVIAKGVVSRHYSHDAPDKDENGNFQITNAVGDQNYDGTSPGMVAPVVTAGMIFSKLNLKSRFSFFSA